MRPRTTAAPPRSRAACTNGAPGQVWHLAPEGYRYRLVPVHSQKCLDVYDWSLVDGGTVVQWACHGGANQNWDLRPSTDIPGIVNLTASGSIIAEVRYPNGGGSRDLEVIRDGDRPPVGSSDSGRQYDTYTDGQERQFDWVGYRFASGKSFSRVIFQEGIKFLDGGWFETLTVQVHQPSGWVPVSNLHITPTYPSSASGVRLRISSTSIPSPETRFASMAAPAGPPDSSPSPSCWSGVRVARFESGGGSDRILRGDGHAGRQCLDQPSAGPTHVRLDADGRSGGDAQRSQHSAPDIHRAGGFEPDPASVFARGLARSVDQLGRFRDRPVAGCRHPRPDDDGIDHRRDHPSRWAVATTTSRSSATATGHRWGTTTRTGNMTLPPATHRGPRTGFGINSRRTRPSRWCPSRRARSSLTGDGSSR